MRILWVCNVVLPVIAQKEKIAKAHGGGWLVGLSSDLANSDNISLTVCFPSKQRLKGRTQNIEYYSFNSNSAEADFVNIINEVKPDIIHIFGTEYKHTLDAVKTAEKLGTSDRVVINIQGMASVIASHYCSGLTHKVLKKQTLRDFIKRTNIKKSAEEFKKRGLYEIEALKKVKHIIGRTDWDRACTWWINPEAEYHFCNETLRPEFYEHEWKAEECERHSIFVSQCGYPIKGFHHMLKAMTLILKRYPDAKLYTTGRELTQLDIKGKLRITYYQLYVHKLIKKYGLGKNVVFLGILDEKLMCERFLKSNVFVSASSIENSPNSVGEAMLLGVPTVTSDVGGVKNMLEHNKDGFIYQADAPYMLAYYVCRIFDEPELVSEFSNNAKKHAQITHNREVNLETMINIYKEIGRVD